MRGTPSTEAPIADVVVLNLTEPGRAARLVVITGEAIVGRRGEDIALDDPETSRCHARLRVVDGELEVTDLNSRNGTFVNGRRIAEPTVLSEGGWLDVGACRFLWDDDATAATMSTDPSTIRAPAPRRGPHGPPAGSGDLERRDVPAPVVDPAHRPKRVRAARSTWIGPALLVVVGLGSLVVLRLFFLQSFAIPSASMAPTLREGDHVIAVTRGVSGVTPSIGDVMIFENPLFGEPGEARYMVKRVVGVPGDELTFDDGVVVRNGTPATEPWVPDGMPTDNFDDGYRCTEAAPCTVPDGQVWVLGDNRTDSFDSRGFGPVSVDTMVGRVALRFWPLGELGGI